MVDASTSSPWTTKPAVGKTLVETAPTDMARADVQGKMLAPKPKLGINGYG
eukprot:CAMPEP_0172720926 /NCGR_PEP_ID=MMETSP1074-20121228/78010_1 /TAXON_ID=2916 /ORGANISM="Ceratium fusus, Strain PA161109" /LENGTH=50 /DNA_ID=CAMNT_0013546549 /DNA_START=70 /DNA_END=219 /DNA_ORIENTATION=-